MSLYSISFVAGILTILAPCVLPLLPVILWWSLAEGKYKRLFVIVWSFVFSAVLFTWIIKMTTIFTGLSGDFWKLFSGILLIVLWIFMLMPKIWNHLSFKSWFEENSSKILNKANMKSWLWWDILLWLSLWPVFTSCSPTYAIILSIILPISVWQALINVLFYALWLWLLLILIGIWWVNIIKRMKWASNPNWWFKKVLAGFIVLTWLSIMTWLDKNIETLLLDNNLFIDTSVFEKKLLDDSGLSLDSRI